MLHDFGRICGQASGAEDGGDVSAGLGDRVNRGSPDLSRRRQPASVEGVAIPVQPEAMPRVLARAFATGVAGIARGRLDGGPEWANAMFLANIGHTRSDLAEGRLDWVTMTPPEWHETDLRRLAAARLTGVSPAYEKEYWRADGSRWPVLAGYVIEPADADRLTVFVIDLTEVKAAEAARHATLIERDARFRALADDVPAMIWMTGEDALTEHLSKSWYDYTGQTVEASLGLGWTETLHPDDHARLAPVRTAFNACQPFDLDFRVRRRDGAYRWMLSSGRPRFAADGSLLGYAGCMTDIHARKTAERELAATQQRLSQALDGTGVGVWEWDAATDIVVISGSTLTISGYRDVDADFVQTDYRRVVHRDDLPGFLAAMDDYVAGRSPEFQCEIRVRTKDGGWIWVLDRGTATDRDATGRARRMVGTLTNIDAAKRAEARLRWTVEHDALTGLANRTLFQSRLAAALAAGPVALALLDIDDFKAVNDVMGHAAGDALLTVLAQRLRDFARPDETVARLGGDEFTILMPRPGDGADVLARLEQLRTELGSPFVHDGRTLTCRSSIGVTFAPCDGDDASALLKNADIAMYASKSQRRGRVTRFEPALGAQVRSAAGALGALREALDAGAVTAVYEPVVRIVSGAMAGCEALPRIAGMPLAMALADVDAELATRLGDRVVDIVLDDIVRWRAQGVLDCQVAINVASDELRRGDYAARLLARLAARNLAPSLLRVEVVETVLLGRGAERGIAALAALNAAGVRIALDDFGTGYASLTHLTRLPLGALKIDRSFVARVAEGGGDHAIVTAITGLGASFGLEVIADGVTDAAQAAALAGLGCAFAQGPYFHGALTADAAARLFTAAA